MREYTYLYSVGDQVLVRDDLTEHTRYSSKTDARIVNTAVGEMVTLRGTIVTIRDRNCGQYQLKEIGYSWTDEMFEPPQIRECDSSLLLGLY